MSDRLSARLALSVYQTIAKREKLNRSGQKQTTKVINGICSIVAISIWFDIEKYSFRSRETKKKVE